MARDNDNFYLKHSLQLAKESREHAQFLFRWTKNFFFKKMKRGKNDSYEILFSKEGKGKEIKS